jgi:carbon storage regulator
MLVLSRKQDQTIVIDRNIRVSILQIKGNVVRVGIDAPKDVRILRAEIESWGGCISRGTDFRARDAGEACQFAEMGGCI